MIEELPEIPEIKTNRQPRVWLLTTILAVLVVAIAAGFVYLDIWSNQPANTPPLAQNNTPNYSGLFNKSEIQFNLPVLTYHYIRTVPNPDEDKLGFRLSVTPGDFYEQMQYLASNGYTTLTPDDLYQALKNNQPLPPKSVLLTFDDGYADFYSSAYPVLKQFNLKATVFVITGFVGDKEGRYLTWDQIREMDNSGLVTIGSHTVRHINVTTNKTARSEIVTSKKTLEQHLGHTVMAFCYPGGQYNSEAALLVAQAGYQLAFTTDIGTAMHFNDRFTLPRTRISGGLLLKQFPLKLLSVTNKPNPVTPTPSPTVSPLPSPSPTPSISPSISPSPEPSPNESSGSEEPLPIDGVEELLE